MLKFIVSLLITQSAFAKPMQILIDPGHGGSDRGAVRGPFVEAELALKISKKLSQKLTESGHKVWLTRTTDVLLPLHRRSEIAKEIAADAFISIHANASVDPRAQGVEIYLQNQLPADEETMYLANLENQNQKAMSESIPTWSTNIDVSAIVQDLYRNHRFHQSADLAKLVYRNWPDSLMKTSHHYIRQAPFFVVSQTDAPAILIEVGYLSHRAEAERLYTEAAQDQIVNGIAKGLDDFYLKTK